MRKQLLTLGIYRMMVQSIIGATDRRHALAATGRGVAKDGNGAAACMAGILRRDLHGHRITPRGTRSTTLQRVPDHGIWTST